MAKLRKRFRPDQRPKQARGGAPRRGLTPAEEQAAAQFEANLLPQTAIPAAAAPIGSRAAATKRLSAEIAEELPVVRRDLRRIGLTYGALLLLLGAIWLIATNVGIIHS
jgi:hypothetical protein